MRNTILAFVFFILQSYFVNAQDTTKQQNVFYIVDSIPIIDDPEEGTGTLNQEDIEQLNVVTTKSEILKYGYPNVDKIIFITTNGR